MNRKLLTISLITVLSGVLLALFVNFLTNDRNVNDWLSERGIGTKALFGIVVVLTTLLLILEYFKFRQNQNSSNTIASKIKYGTTQTIKSGNNSQNYQAGSSINVNHKDND